MGLSGARTAPCYGKIDMWRALQLTAAAPGTVSWFEFAMSSVPARAGDLHLCRRLGCDRGDPPHPISESIPLSMWDVSFMSGPMLDSHLVASVSASTAIRQESRSVS